MRGRNRKQPGRAQGHRKHVEVEVHTRPDAAPRGTDIVPLRPPPDDLLPATVEEWKAFWASPYARVVDWSRDRQAIERLFWLYDERRRLAKAGRKKRLVAGSTGQLSLNPLLRQLTATDSEIRQLEDRFGLNPRAAIALGVRLGDLAKTMEDLNREANDDRDEEEPDPRKALTFRRAQ